MKYRPLCTNYLTDARTQLEEVADSEERPQLIIEPVMDTVEQESSSESECEEQQAPPPPRPPRPLIHKRARFSLEDDASFDFFTQVDSAKDKHEDETKSLAAASSQEDERATAEEALPGEESLEPSAEMAGEASTDEEPQQEVLEDDIFSIDSSSDEEVVAAQPFQLVTQVTKLKRSTAFVPSPAANGHPLDDTDDEELDDIESRINRRLAQKEFPSVVEVSSLHHSPMDSPLLLESQSQDTEMVEFEIDNEGQDLGTSSVLHDAIREPVSVHVLQSLLIRYFCFLYP